MPLIPALSVAEATAKDRLIDYAAWMPQARWEQLDHALDDLHGQATDFKGQQTYQTVFNDFASHSLTQGPVALEQLRAWRAARPDSPFPLLLEASYWSAWFQEYRSTSTVDAITDVMWACAHTAQDALLCVLLEGLSKARAETLWPAFSGVIYSVAAVGEPQWWDEWLTTGQRPTSLAAHDGGDPDEVAAMLARSGAEHVPGSGFCQRLPDTLPAMLTGECLAWRQSQQGPLIQYWLRVALSLHGHALEIAICYVQLRMPRWGGSIEEMLAFADSPLCAHFDEAERDILRFFAWFDDFEVDEYLLHEHAGLAQQQLRVGKKLLERPLPDNLRGRVHKYMAHLWVVIGRADKACQHYAASAPCNRFDDGQVNEAIEAWAQSDREGSWLGQMAAFNRLTNAQGAALYGFLCAHGLAGVERRADVAEEWYRYAVSRASDPADVVASPFNSLSPLGELYGDEAMASMWVTAAQLGDASSQFKAGNHFDHLGDRMTGLHYFRMAADNQHESAAMNVAALLVRPIIDDDWQGAEADEATREAVMFANRSLELARQKVERRPGGESGAYFREFLGTIQKFCCALLSHSALPIHVRHDMLPTVTNLGQGGYFKAMKTLAQWHGDRESRYFDFREAVRWIEAARRVDPEDEHVVELLQDIQGTGLFARIRYGRMRDAVVREGLPGD
jgi:hypothetical protein